MEIATPTRSSPFPKLTFDHKLIIAKHLVSTNDEKRKTPNHLIGDESSTCDLKDQNYENGAKTRLNETKIIGGAKPKTIEKTTVGIKPIIVQRQDDMPSKMSENHFNGAALMMTINGDDLCNSNNNNVNRDNTISNIKLSYDVHKSLDENNTSVKVHDDDGLNHDELNHNCNININSNGDNYNENCIKSTSTSEGRVSSSGTLNSGISVSNKETTFKVPEFAVSNSHSGSPSPSPSAPYRKQSVFVAPAGLNWIIHKSNRNNQQQQQQPLQHVRQISNKHNLIDPSEVSTLPATVTTSLSTMVCSPSSYQCIPTSSFYSSSSAQSSSLSTTSSSASSRSTSSTLYASSLEINGETLSNNSSSSLIGNNNSSKSVNNSSSSSNFTANRKNSTGLQPKANAQEIEQHISKIISENAAIVETLDPLWSKRYLSRHSVSSLPSGSTSPYPTTSASTSTTHSINSLPSRRYSEIVVDPNHVSGSKLQSALLGRILTTSSLTSGTTVVTPSNVPHVHQHSTLSGYPGPTKKFSEPNYPSVIINMKQQQQALQKSNAINKVSNTSTSGTVGIGSQSSDSHETGLEPSLVRNLLTSSKSPATVRVIPVPVSSSSSLPSTSISSQISTVTGSPIAGLTLSSIHRNNNSSTSTTAETILADNSFSANPENPEGSIIKDLLLKARDSNSETNERKNSRANLIPPIQEELSMLVYVCTLCKIAFRNKETLEAHQLHYCKANETQSTINEFSPNQLQLLNDHVQRKISVMESNFLQQQLTKPVQSSICPNPKQLGSSTNVFSQPQNVNIINKQHHYQSSSNQSLHQQNQPIVGNILKQQLLAPSAGPPMKKRKTSEPLFTKSYLRQNHNNANSHHQLNHNQQYSTTATTTNESNSHFVRKTSVVQSPPSKLLHIGGNKSNTKEGLIESDCLNNISGLSPSVALSSYNVVNDDTSSSNHVISVLNEPMAFSSTNIVITQSGPFSSANQHNFINQSSLDRLSSSIANQSTKPLDILPDYYPHLKCPETKVTLTGPIVFSVLRKILLENKENVEFQASPEALHTSESSPPFTLSSTSTSSSSSLPSTLTVAATTTSASTINSSDQATKDVISTTTANSSYLVYKQIPSIPEFDEDEMEEKVDDKMIISSIKNEDTPSSSDGGICKNKRSNFTNQYPIKMDGKSSQQQCINPIENEETGQKDEKGENEAVEMKQQQHQPPTEECKPIINESNRKFDSKINGVNISNRPTSLTIRKRSLTNVFNKLIGSTLVSPDTPRPKRKCMQLYMKGQTYTYLNLKMSTRSTYCCIYRPQPMYVPQEAQSKLSMYSNWQIISPHDDIFKLISPSELFHAYDTRQWCYRRDGVKVTFAPSSESKKSLNDSFILTPSTYWTIKRSAEEKANIKREIMELKRKGVEDLTDLMDKSVINMNNNNNCRKTSEDRLSTMSGFDSDSNDPNQPKRVKIFEGGFKSNEDYTYVRGRGRGKYVCEECGIRCKKPSMLKKHIRTHTDLRPYSCRHCAFAFKTKGNLTKHMKSKAHHKKCVELGIIPVPITIDESQIDCDALAKQEALERSYSGGHLASDDDENDPDDEDGCEEEEDDGSDDEGVPIPIITSSGVITTDHRKMDVDGGSEERKEREHKQSIIVANEVDEQEVARSLLVLSGSGEWSVGSNPAAVAVAAAIAASASGVTVASNCLEAHYSDIPRTTASSPTSKQQHIEMISDLRKISQSSSSSSIATTSSSLSINKSSADERSPTVNSGQSHYVNNLENWTPSITSFNHSRQRSFSFNDGLIRRNQNNHHHPSMVPNLDNLRRFERQTATFTPNNFCLSNEAANATSTSSATPIIEPISTDDDNDSEIEDHFQRRYSMSVIQDRYNEPFYLNSEGPIDLSKRQEENDSANAGPSSRYDQTLPGRRNTLSTPSAAAHHLSRAELAAAINGSSIGVTREDGKSVCRKCNKTFRELSQLRLHVNVHYLERPFRCESCGVSFRTKGHLQKHEKSVTHSDKVRINLSFGTPTTENPRPFRCDDCNTAFRIHGHLAKHLRSKNHIMKLECAGKLPCGMYADMERFNINLNVIETADCENSLISLQKLAEKMYAKNGEVDLSWLRQSTSNGNNINCSNQPNPAPTALTSTSAPAAPFITTVNGMNHNSEPNMNISNNYDPNLTNVNNDYNNNNSSDNIVINSITAVNNNIEVNNNHNTNFHYNSVNNTPSSLSLPLSIASSTYPASSTSSTPSSSIIPPPPPTTSFTTTPITISTTTSATTNITSTRSNTCHYCKQVFKSAKFLQVHLYCDHQQQRSSSPNLVTDPQPQPQAPTI